MNRSLRTFVGALLALGCVAWMADPALAAKRVLRIKLDGELHESPPQGLDLMELMGGNKPRTLRSVLDAVQKAADDREIAGMVLLVEQPRLSMAQVEELNRAFKAFRERGKHIHCYIDTASNSSYAIASAADRITLADFSSLDIMGLRAELSFYKGLLDKIGVQADMLHCGDYKTALEPFTRTAPSKENAEMVNWLLDGLYDRFVRMIAENRGLTPEQVKAAIDTAPLEAQQALKLKLVDAVASFADFKQSVEKEYGKDLELVKKYPEDEKLKFDFSNPFAMFQMFSKALEEAQDEGKPGIALVYIDGGIMLGRNEPDFLSGGTSAGSTTIRRAFEKARTDENVKAVVVRVNSPGGSALASDIMWEAATRCAKEKPLIVSMGGVAGSGGYYVSIPADTIFAEETTITGSIGVVGGKLVTHGLFDEKLGITTTEFERGKRAGLFSTNRPWTEEERQFMAGYMNSIYEQFKGRVKQSRGDRIKGELEPLAGGRVYTGKQALERGLVDKIGGLADALQYARQKAGLMKDCQVYVLPKPIELGDILKELMGEETDKGWEADAATPLVRSPLLPLVNPLLQGLPPAATEKVMRGLRNLMILDQERVGMFMPFELELK